MNIEKLLAHFPGAEEAYISGSSWSWQPTFADGYPHPYYDEEIKGWGLLSIYPGFVMDSGSVEVHVHEMTESGGNVAAFALPMSAGEDVLQGLFVDISHRCWKATKGYLEYARITGLDPLSLCESGDETGVAEAALAALVEHLSTPHGRLEAIEGDGNEYTH